MDAALAATLLGNNDNASNNVAPQIHASTAPSQPNLSSSPYQLPQTNTTSHAPSSTRAAPPSWPSSPSSSTSSLDSPDATFGMHLGGLGGITMSSCPNGDLLSFGGPSGITMSSGPLGSHMTFGVPNIANLSRSPSIQQGLPNNSNAQIGSSSTPVTVNGIPVDPFNNPFNHNTFPQSGHFNCIGNVNIGNNIIPGPYDPYTNGTNWDTVHSSLWLDHVRQRYQQGMALGAQVMNDPFNALNGMGTGSWGMGGSARTPKHKKKGKGRLHKK